MVGLGRSRMSVGEFDGVPPGDGEAGALDGVERPGPFGRVAGEGGRGEGDEPSRLPSLGGPLGERVGELVGPRSQRLGLA